MELSVVTPTLAVTCVAVTLKAHASSADHTRPAHAVLTVMIMMMIIIIMMMGKPRPERCHILVTSSG